MTLYSKYDALDAARYTARAPIYADYRAKRDALGINCTQANLDVLRAEYYANCATLEADYSQKVAALYHRLAMEAV